MSAPPAEVLAAAGAVKAPADTPVVILFEETVHSYEDAHRSHHRYRQVYKILSQHGIEGWDRLSSGWAPWYEDKPALRARVVVPGGRTFGLDPKTIETSGMSGGDEAVFSDRQLVRAPIPGVAVGAVVEVEIEWTERAPLFEAGTTHRFFFGGTAPVEKARLQIDYPGDLHVDHVIRNVPSVIRSLNAAIDNGHSQISESFEGGPFAALPEEVPGQPPETTLPGYIAYTTGASWATVAAAYADIVDRQIGKPDLASYVRDAKKGLDLKRDREAIIGRLVARLGADVKYTGIEFGEASIVPRTPAEVFERRYGDCKDKALLLTALLRSAGIAAEVALLDSGFGPDVDPDVPGFGSFDHAIVYLPGSRPLWIDATDRFSAVGELPLGDQGRLALVAARGTKALVRTPEAPSTVNLTREDRTISVAEDGKVWVVEVSDLTGSAAHAMRADYSRAEKKQIDERLASYVRSTYHGKTLGRWETSDFYDVSRPLRIDLETSDAGIGSISDDEVSVMLPLAELFERLPDFLRNPEGAEHKRAGASAARALDYVYGDAHAHELRYKIAAPHGFAPDPPPADETVTLGPARYTAAYRIERDGTLDATFRFDSGKPRFSPSELTAFLAAMKTLGDRHLPSVTFHQTGEAELTAGRVRQALAEFRRLDAQHPHEALHACQIARVTPDAGLGAAKRASRPGAGGRSTLSRHAPWGRWAGCWSTTSSAGGSGRGPIRRGPRRPIGKRSLWTPTISGGARLAGDPARARRRRGADLPARVRPPDRGAAASSASLRKAERTGLLVNQLLDLLYAERFKEILADKEAVAGNATAQGIYVAGGGGDGESGGGRQDRAGAHLRFRSGTRGDAARGAELMALRRYQPALGAAGRGGAATGPAPRRCGQLADRLRTTRRREELKLDDRTPSGAARLFFSIFFSLAGSPMRRPSRA